MLLLPIPGLHKLGRLFSRELPQDRLDNANDQIQYAKEHHIIGDREEPILARELASRKMKRALQQVDRDRAAREQLPIGQAPEGQIEDLAAKQLLWAADQKRLPAPPADDGRDERAE
ncbi:MAG TPA: hypothetical protein VK774_03620 [Solirubrobacteraceae bacterium]|jgi:hypothetical protein|nr:hypothetical protein [Solirubrobacteraceae bacterium]